VLSRTTKFAVFAALFVLTGCSMMQPAPVVEIRTYRIPAGALDKVAVIPFHAKDTLAKHVIEGGDSPETATQLMARFLTEALVERGYRVIPPSDLALVMNSQGITQGKRNPLVAAEVAAREFGATAVMLGEVSRYRDRAGERYGSSKAASVAFEVSLHSAPAGHRLWTATFDETQRALSENVFNARRYPGGGTRWLTAAEFARWGAESAVDTLPTPH
jgi:hypothetical protein